MMKTTRILATTAIGFAALAASSAHAQAEGEAASTTSEIPAGYEALPLEYTDTETVEGTGDVETITRTRWIRRAPATETAKPMAHGETYPAHHHGYSPYPITFDRETWLEECRARTRDIDDDDKKGGIIGGLLGAIGGGIIGNRAWDSERLAGTVIGAGVGGLAGAVIGSALDGDDDYRMRYDCEAALDRYMSGGSYYPHRMASRSIPAYGYGYAPMVMAYAPAYGYQQTMAMIESREEIPQQVIVREYVTEEWVDVPTRERIVEEVVEERYEPAPSKVVPIKRRPTKVQPIKGN